MMTRSDDTRAAVRRHLESFWPDAAQDEFTWTLGPARRQIPEFRVRRISPARSSDPWVYVTIGASPDVADRLEFAILSPTESPRHVESLAMVASLHADSSHTLSVGSVVNIGRPWIDGGVADHFLVSLPYPFGPSLENCLSTAGRTRIVWLVPVTAREAAFARESGVGALEEALDQAAADMLAPDRTSVI